MKTHRIETKIKHLVKNQIYIFLQVRLSCWLGWATQQAKIRQTALK
jgi:hypothetical protein